MPRDSLIKIRSGSTEQWAEADAASADDPERLLAAGEPGRDTTTGMLKVGDGTTAFADLTGYPDEEALASTYAPHRDRSVLEYGADPTGETDSTAAFLAAVEEASPERRPVHVPAGRYAVALALTDQNVSLYGPGTLVQRRGAAVVAVSRTWGDPVEVRQEDVTIGPPNGSTVGTQVLTTLIPRDGSCVGYRSGDVYWIGSADAYPWSAAALGTSVFQAAFVPLLGVGLGVSAVQDGGPTEGLEVVGSSSGARALVRGVVLDGSTGTVLTSSISADFTIGERLLQNGSPVGTVSAQRLVMAGRLDDTYRTTPQIRRVPTDRLLRLEGLRIEADGDIDAVVGAEARRAAVVLAGAYGPVVRDVTVVSAWSRALQVTSCFTGEVDVVVDRLPNSALLSEQAYGYGVELRGCTEAVRVRLRARRVRHGFTTNPSGSSAFASSNPFQHGTVKRNVVHDSVVTSPWAAGFDTHEGAYATVFQDCRVSMPASAASFQTTATCFQNRGFGTVYRDCLAEGGTVGFSEGGAALTAGFTHRVQYLDCTAEGWQFTGFRQDNAAASAEARVELVGCHARGDGAPANAPYFQSAYYLRGGQVRLQGCTASRFNGLPLRLAGPARAQVVDFLADYADGSGRSGMRADATLLELDVVDYRVRLGASAPTSLFRNFAGDTTWNVDGVAVLGSGPRPPVFVVDAGAPTFRVRGYDAASGPSAVNGDADVTLTHTSPRTQVWASPLTAGRTVSLSAAAGTVAAGDRFRLVRTAAATGAALTLVGAGPPRAVPPGTWVEVQLDAAAGWFVIGSGPL